MPEYKDVIFQKEGIGYFPNFVKSVIHGFTWGKRFRNMSFQVGNQDRVKTDMEEYLSILDLGRLADTVNIAAEHGDRIITVDETLIDGLALNNFGKEIVCDAVFTRLTNVSLLLKPGDCVGLIVYAESLDGPIIGIVHAGWRGIDLGLPHKAIGLLIHELSADVRTIKVGMTPFLFGEGMVWPNIEKLAKPSNWGSGLVKRDGGYELDMGLAAVEQLLNAGLEDSQIEIYRVDTYQAALTGDGFSYKASKMNANIADGRFVLGARLKG